MFTYTFCHPVLTTLPIDKLSFESSLGTLRISLCDHNVIEQLPRAFIHTFCHSAPTTLSNLNLSFVSSLGTPIPSLPAFWMTFSLLVGLQSAILSVSAPAARSLLPLFMQATCLCCGDTEFIYWLYYLWVQALI